MSSCCNAMGQQVMLLACSGMSNVGQLSNQAAIRLHQEGLGAGSCAVGIAAGVEGLTKAATEVPFRVVIDGCAVACARIGLERQGLEPDVYLQVTDLGIEKAKVFDLPDEQVERTVAAVKAAMAGGAG